MGSVRGSRKHILDWVERTTFPQELSSLVRSTGAIVTGRGMWMPRGHDRSREARLECFGPHALPGVVEWQALQSWWLVHNGRAATPTWDLVATCNIGHDPGLILVEAKANTSELKVEGKLLRGKPSWRSRENHARIAEAIDEARRALNATAPGVSIRVESHYQLSKRIAFAWKVADLGLETVLIYLGFLGDPDITDVGEPLRDHGHWLSVFSEHARAVLPVGFCERRLDCGGAGMWLIVRSLALKAGGSGLPD